MTMRIADAIRSHVVDRYIEPARRRGEPAVTVTARDVLRDMRFRTGRAPAVCDALRARKFLREQALEVEVEGPPSKRSTTTTFTYRLLGGPDTAGRPARNGIRSLRGIGRETFAALGGGERWLRRERESFHEADDAAGKPSEPDASSQ